MTFVLAAFPRIFLPLDFLRSIVYSYASSILLISFVAMAAALPDDLLHMVCGQLWEQRDFDTLYHCALTGKQLAIPALASIYR